MAALRNPQNPLRLLHSSSKLRDLELQNRRIFAFLNTNAMLFARVPVKFQVLRLRCSGRYGDSAFCSFCKQNSKAEAGLIHEEEEERPPFDINLAVVLAGFAFEAYSSPPEKIGRREVDAADCQTVFLSGTFLREVYDGQLLIKLKKGVNFPAMDPWGTSDPYVVFQLDGQVVKSKVKWGTKDPEWNEDLTLNIKIPTTKNLQVAAWDANLVTPHKRMGNAQISLEALCDGNLHEVLLELQGLGGGGTIYLEVKYRSFDDVEEDKSWWRIAIPYIPDLFVNSNFDSTFKAIFGSEAVKAQEFVRYAFRQLKGFDYMTQKDQLFMGKPKSKDSSSGVPLLQESIPETSGNSLNADDSSDVAQHQGNDSAAFSDIIKYIDDGGNALPDTKVDKSMQSNKSFWNNLTSVLQKDVFQKVGFSIPEKVRWDGLDLLDSIGLQAKKIAEAGYVESGLAAPQSQGVLDVKDVQSSTMKVVESSLADIKKLSSDILRQTDSILGALMMLNMPSKSQKKDSSSSGRNDYEKDSLTTEVDNVSSYSKNENISTVEGSLLDPRKTEEMKALFATAESAMEAWAMLASSLGHPSFIKSEFEKICFLDNTTTDTQVAIWRDSSRNRLVVAFRGTEQARWKDLRTDLMLVPAGHAIEEVAHIFGSESFLSDCGVMGVKSCLNPERVGGDFKQEVQVHSGFLSAYDSVRIKLMSLIKLSIGFVDDDAEVIPKWHIYVTGHSLGGALATLLSLELSSSLMARCGIISVTMYNFGSPRVGNKRFVEIYNEKVKDSWRIVNHRDIIPTVPRLMGYCHVAQPVYLAARDLRDALDNMELLVDGNQGDVIGEATPDVLVGEFLKGEKELIGKILQTEINLFRSIRDGSALMQHMEDFYYITLLENVMSNYQTAGNSNSDQQGSMPTG